MASIHGYFEWYDWSKGFGNIADYRGNTFGLPNKPASIAAALDNNEFKYYRFLVDKAGLFGRYDDPQAEFTIFAPRDDTLNNEMRRFITNADMNVARQLVDASTIPRVIREKTLMEPGVYWADTRNSPERILVESRPDKGIYVSGHQVIETKLDLQNGIVYAISGLIIPSCIL
jgi:hypothetical protein